MRALPVLVTGALASVTTSVAVWAALEFEDRHAPGYEVVEDQLIITTAATPLVHRTVEEVLLANRSLAFTDEAANEASRYRFAARAWFSRSALFSTLRERAARTVFSQQDATGAATKVELFTSSESPTFLFIDHPNALTRSDVARQIANRLAEAGVRER